MAVIDTNPLKGRHGVLLYSAQSVQGTAVTPATAAGIASFSIEDDGDLRPISTLGQAAPLFLKPGIAKVPFQITIPQVQTAALLAKVIRSSGVVPWLTFAMGVTDDAGTHYAWQVSDCKIDKIDLSLEAGGFLSATMSGTGGLITNPTTLVQAHLSPKPLMSYEAVLDNGSAFESKSFRCAINNNIDVQTVIPGVAPSAFKRGWNYQTESNLEITGEVSRFKKSGSLYQADTLSSVTLTLTVTDIAGGMSPNTVVLVITGCTFGKQTIALGINSDLMYTLPFIATGVTLS